MKKILALAIATAFAAPAFAATSNVDIYGKLHMSLSIYNDQWDGESDMQFSSNASRIGFKGAEDLGGGLSAIWQIESGVALDEQSGTWANRNSFVGLKGGWGTFLLGNHDTPFKLVGRTVDLFGDTIADSRNVMGGGNLLIGVGPYTNQNIPMSSDMRADNVAVYVSPNMGGFTFTGAYSTDPVSLAAAALPATLPDYDESDVWSVSGTYANGGLYLGAAYSDGDAIELLGQDNNWRLAAGYTFGNFKVVGQYDSYSSSDNTANVWGFAIPDYDSWMLGAAFTMGNMVFKANYMDGEFDNVLDVSQFTVGMDYNLSKRTSVYVLYADAENTGLGFGAGSSDQVWPDNEDVSAFSFGVVHTF